MLKNIFEVKLIEDIKVNKNNFKSIFIISFFRLSHFFSTYRSSFFISIVGLPIRILYKIIVEWILCVELPASTRVGKGLRIQHGQGLVVNADVIIGDYVTLKHNTTLGCRTNSLDQCIGSPIIENNVVINPHSAVIGKIIIGHNSLIGIGSVVLNNVHPYSVVAGNPASIIKVLKNDNK